MTKEKNGVRQLLGALALISVVFAGVESARILAVLPIPGRSHHISMTSLTKALAAKGHEVTLISAFPSKTPIPNHKDLTIPNIFDDLIQSVGGGSQASFFEMKSPWRMHIFMWFMGEMMSNATLNNEAVMKELNKPNVKFDLIILEAHFLQEALLGLGHKFKAPVVAFHPFGMTEWIADASGNALNPAYVPNAFLDTTDNMCFFSRFFNTIYTAFQHVSNHLYYYPRQDALLHHHFPDAPPMLELRKNISITLLNNHYSLFYPLSLAPNVVEVGGMHIKQKPDPLPKDLKDYMDSAKDGVVYFSMGSNIRLVELPEPRRQIFIDALGTLKHKVILKWDAPIPEKLPSNILVKNWCPQADLLAHPNMRLFVTHGGLLSTQEAIFHGVPLVGMPVFGDQEFNMKLAVKKEFAVKVDFHEMTKESFVAGLQEALSNKKYRESAKRMSRLFRAQPTTPLEKAVYWVEHVLEHGGEHLKPASVNLNWAQLMLLDVIAVALLPFVVLIYLCRRCCCGKRSSSPPPKTTGSKKKN